MSMFGVVPVDSLKGKKNGKINIHEEPSFVFSSSPGCGDVATPAGLGSWRSRELEQLEETADNTGQE